LSHYSLPIPSLTDYINLAPTTKRNCALTKDKEISQVQVRKTPVKKGGSKKKRDRANMNQEPEYVKSDYELYVEEKRKRNAEHMKQWDIKAAKEQQQKKDVEPSHVPTTVVQDMTTEDPTTKTTHNYTSNNNTDHNAVDSSQEPDAQDYRDENNWTVEFFVMHKEHTFTIKFNKKKLSTTATH
jgi:hypothetical protein